MLIPPSVLFNTHLSVGESKGYGLIKYASSEAAAQAKHLLDGRSVGDGSHLIDCEWLNSSRVTFASLHSRALYVDNLPPGYRDMADFRRLFSAVKNPAYCQVGKIFLRTRAKTRYVRMQIGPNG